MIQFLVHNKGDLVGVAVVDIPAGQRATGLVMDGDEKIEVQASEDISLGHKIALEDIPANTPVIKYSHPIGNSVKDIKKGEHVHIHNLKTARW